MCTRALTHSFIISYHKKLYSFKTCLCTWFHTRTIWIHMTFLPQWMCVSVRYWSSWSIYLKLRFSCQNQTARLSRVKFNALQVPHLTIGSFFIRVDTVLVFNTDQYDGTGVYFNFIYTAESVCLGILSSHLSIS